MKKPAQKIQDVQVALNMIVKYDEPQEIVGRCIRSTQPTIDRAYITVTHDGTKKTKSQAKELGKYLTSKYKANISYYKWDYSFANARNYALEQVPEDFYYILWLDADDILQKPLEMRQIAREGVLYNHAAVFFDYWYAVDLDENFKVKEVIITHKRERLVRNNKTFKWIGRLHETLIQQKQENIIKVHRKECVVVHLSNTERTLENIERNIKILEIAIKEEGRKDPRTIMHLARVYYDKGSRKEKEEDRDKDWNQAIKLFNEYLEGSGAIGDKDHREGSGWHEERAQAWEAMSEIYRNLGKHNLAIKSCINAVIEAPMFPQFAMQMAMIYTTQEDWKRADTWLQIGADMGMPETTIIISPRDLKARYLECKFHISMARNKLEDAKSAIEMLLDIMPDMPHLQQRMKDVESLERINKVGQSVLFLGKYLEAHKESDKLKMLINAIPKELEGEQFISQMKNKFMPPRRWGDNEIAIMCGPGAGFVWNPKNSKDCGGSEEAVIHIGRELTKLGYKITVYGNPGDESGDYDGVNYKHWHEFNRNDAFNIMVIWRMIGFVDVDFNAKQIHLWMHDVPNNADFTKERVEKLNKIIPLSKYHKSLFKMSNKGEFVDIPEDKFFLSANGIGDININKKWKRKKNRMIWTSSYDRGLSHLLLMWPKIKQEIPDATLDIYYGWDLFDKLNSNNPARMKWRAQMVQLMTQSGIKEHGKISMKQIAKEMATSDYFVYPTDFQEISCISAMKAQATGAIPIVTDYAALSETVRYGHKLDYDVTDPDERDEFANKLIEIVTSDKTNVDREEMMRFAQENFKWNKVAKQWDELFQATPNVVTIK